MGSRFSSDRRPSSVVRALLVVAGLALASTQAACVTVRPEEREFLADPSMTFGSGGTASEQEQHVFDNREASFGGGSVSGGGCGCN